MSEFYSELLERFLRYVVIDTGSLPNVKEVPSTRHQFDLAYLLKDELVELGVSNIYLDEINCVVYGTIPSTLENGKGKSIGLVAHMDTSPDVSSENIKPWVYKNYQGGDIVLNKDLQIIMKEEEFPHLKNYYGDDLVLTDGTTLLGGDDKAAISEIMTMAHYFIKHPEIKHGPIQIAFTPDEEVGGLACNLDLKRFGAVAAYTVDGDYVGYYSDETFNATEAQLTITGKNVHPGTAKGIMKNAVGIANEIIDLLPPLERPEFTEGREGYFHPHYIQGNVEKSELHILIRDHDDNSFYHRQQIINDITKKMNEKYGEGTVVLRYANGYLSMKKVVDTVPYLIPSLVKAISKCNIEPYHLAFRGGTDGSALSQRGLPCPNISAGYENGHSRFEFVPVQSMEKITEILIQLFIELAKEDA